MIRRHTPIKRSLKRIAFRSKSKAKARRKRENPEYLAWLRAWPCFVCFKEHCEKYNLSFSQACARPDCRQLFLEMKSLIDCGPTEAAHVGAKGTGQKCPDREAMPLGFRHHRHPTDGGFPDSHHAGTRTFWGKHGLSREVVFQFLWSLYKSETGGAGING